MKQALSLCILAWAMLVYAGSPKPVLCKFVLEQPYRIDPVCSNTVIYIYKCQWLGTTTSPWKRAGIWPSTRTNFTVTVLPGIYYFRVTVDSPNCGGESDPSPSIRVQIQ